MNNLLIWKIHLFVTVNRIMATDIKCELSVFDYLKLCFSHSADIYEQVSSGLDALGLTSECVGGGRIQHSPNSKKIFVYGYSMVSRKIKNC